jgi:polyhydroxyalkanoate synthesis regulator phasin
VALGSGISILPRIADRPEDHSSLVYRELSGRAPTREVVVVRHLLRYQSKGAELFLKVLREATSAFAHGECEPAAFPRRPEREPSPTRRPAGLNLRLMKASSNKQGCAARGRLVALVSGLPGLQRAPSVSVLMIDLIKKTLLAGVGATIITKEKVEEALQDYIRQGKVSAGDARIMADKIAEQGRKEFETMSGELAAKLKELAEKADFTQGRASRRWRRASRNSSKPWPRAAPGA